MLDFDFAAQAEKQAENLLLKTEKQITEFLKQLEQDTALFEEDY